MKHYLEHSVFRYNGLRGNSKNVSGSNYIKLVYLSVLRTTKEMGVYRDNGYLLEENHVNSQYAGENSRWFTKKEKKIRHATR